MNWVRRIILSVGVFSIVMLALAGHYYSKGFYKPAHRPGAVVSSFNKIELQRLRGIAALQKVWVQRHGFNSRFCFLVDMQVASGRRRFFVYDLQKDCVLLSGMVAHGSGAATFSVTPTFPNVNGSGWTRVMIRRLTGMWFCIAGRRCRRVRLIRRLFVIVWDVQWWRRGFYKNCRG